MGGEKDSQCRILVRARLLYKIFYDLSVHFTISHVYGRYFKISCSVLGNKNMTQRRRRQNENNFQYLLFKLT